MSKYYKSKYSELIVEYIGGDNNLLFQGIIKSEDRQHKHYHYKWVYDDFTEYTPTPQELIEWGETATLSNENPNKVEVDDKDVNLRLECLKLAIMVYNTAAIDKANEFYEWVTQKPLIND